MAQRHGIRSGSVIPILILKLISATQEGCIILSLKHNFQISKISNYNILLCYIQQINFIKKIAKYINKIRKYANLVS